MTENKSEPASASGAKKPVVEKAPWGDLFRDGRTLFSILVLLGVILHALNILLIAIVMPTVVADIGGAAYYTWPAMLYTIGSIIGAASVGPVWARFGPRKGYAFSAVVFLIGTIGSALAPDMGWLIAARGVQGVAGGLIAGGGMALVSALYGEALRTRILAMYQGTWMVAQLFGPVIGGIFAQIGWWRGAFWTLLPFILVFVYIAWTRLPDRFENEAADAKPGGFPLLRLLTLTSGVFLISLAGPVDEVWFRVLLLIGGIFLICLTFRLDRFAENRLYPSAAFSFRSPVGLALWILLLGGLVQTSVPLFLPLLLQVVHNVPPLYVSYVSIILSLGWTIGTFTVSGWTGARERAALWGGPLLMMVGLAGITVTAQHPMLVVLTASAFVLGFGVGTHNVHLLSRTMAAALKGEERITAAALPSIRSLGTAMGAAIAGMLSGLAGLGDATDAAAVGPAITFVYGFNLIPLAVTACFMFMLLRLDGKGASNAG